MMRSLTDRPIALVAIFGALTLVLSYLEGVVFSFLPLPFPGLKLGLANVAVLLAYVIVSPRASFFCALLKTLSSFLLFGSAVSFLMSFSGTMLAFILMFAVDRLLTDKVSPVGLSAVSCLGHVTAQIAVATVFSGSNLFFSYYPVLLSLSIPLSVINGLICILISGKIKK